MKLKIYRIFYLLLLFSTVGLTTYSLVDTILKSLNNENKEECIIFSLCLLVLIVFLIFQIINLIRSFFKGGQFIHYLVFDNKEFEINKKFLIVINILLLLVIGILIYFILILFNDYGLVFNNSFIGVKYLFIDFSITIIINFIFIDLYLLVYKEDKIIRKY